MTLRFALPTEGEACFTVFDPAERVVRELYAGRLPAGEHALAWDGRDGGGRPLAAGLYVVRLEAAELSMVRRVVRLGAR